MLVGEDNPSTAASTFKALSLIEAYPYTMGRRIEKHHHVLIRRIIAIKTTLVRQLK
jgi:hypothetical protein